MGSNVLKPGINDLRTVNPSLAAEWDTERNGGLRPEDIMAGKPGDIIFFQGTYNTSGASHVAIYVGDGMMIHCGNPIQYASINSSYWQAHFYCFGRLP